MLFATFVQKINLDNKIFPISKDRLQLISQVVALHHLKLYC